jgi:hypothetical protein
MNNKFAGCDEQQSGQRFLDSSAPRLIRHVVSCETAGGDWSSLEWDTYPLPAGKDQKLSWGFGGEATDERAIGACLPSLDSIPNNRHSAVPDYYARPLGRGKYCGRWSIRGKDPKTGRTVFRRVNCGSWTCSYCGPRKAKLAKFRIRQQAENLDLRFFLTLTLDPSKVKNERDQVKYVRLVFNRFREYLRRKYGQPPKFICILEFTKRGTPHLHILLDRYIPHEWISRTWDKLGGGRIVFIKKVTIRNVSRYLSKYLTKDLLLSAPKGARRITTARGIKLFPKFDSGIVWEFLRESIWQLLASQRAASLERQSDLFRCILLHMDEESFLKAFELVADA